jgi:polysaccharide pyruvyl transferase WcaK-like protein
MKQYGIVSYNIHGNYTNYGSVLQSYALQTAINSMLSDTAFVKIINYIPEKIIGKDPLNPLKSESNPSNEFIQMVKESMPAIIENYEKINSFIKQHYLMSNKTYSSLNFDETLKDEKLDGYIVGSDAIWMVDFFGWDRGFWGDFKSMVSTNTIAYAASFGESLFNSKYLQVLNDKVGNFKAIGLREPKYLQEIKAFSSIPVQQVVDPTLLLCADDYNAITAERCIAKPYILVYSRKYNSTMDEYADTLAKMYGYEVVEISLRAQNKHKHIMFYNAGIEEFLSLIKYSEGIVTNSLHASIFATLFHKPISFFERGNACYKVKEFFNAFDIEPMFANEHDSTSIRNDINYEKIDKTIDAKRKQSIEFLKACLSQ